MRGLPLIALLAAGSGCIVYETRPYRPVPPPAAPATRLLGENEAVNIAFDAARQRGLQVSRVHRAFLDDSARWHVDLAGRDRANLLIDARTGRLLKGKFREWDDWAD
ncbi:MAG TPA: hypothetical protein VLU43_16555 [Anaeromyxobacteraceae bacterium]|nr:hypothetical protein [Anaeromyxobacteraceae bacterium]